MGSGGGKDSVLNETGFATYEWAEKDTHIRKIWSSLNMCLLHRPHSKKISNTEARDIKRMYPKLNLCSFCNSKKKGQTNDYAQDRK